MHKVSNIRVIAGGAAWTKRHRPGRGWHYFGRFRLRARWRRHAVRS